jgi:hypothetical protein
MSNTNLVDQITQFMGDSSLVGLSGIEQSQAQA